jgi:hypothetical protein
MKRNRKRRKAENDRLLDAGIFSSGALSSGLGRVSQKRKVVKGKHKVPASIAQGVAVVRKEQVRAIETYNVTVTEASRAFQWAGCSCARAGRGFISASGPSPVGLVRRLRNRSRRRTADIALARPSVRRRPVTPK